MKCTYINEKATKNAKPKQKGIPTPEAETQKPAQKKKTVHKPNSPHHNAEKEVA